MSTFRCDRLLALALAPASEPLTLAETKLFLRVDLADEDTLITQMIEAARRAAEQHMRRSLLTQQWKLVFADALPPELALPMGPVQQIIRVTTVNKAGTAVDLDASLYTLNAAKTALQPEQLVAGHRVEVVYQAGYGNAATDVPLPIRHGMLAHIAAMYDGRGVMAAMPPAAATLYFPWMETSL